MTVKIENYNQSSTVWGGMWNNKKKSWRINYGAL